MATPTVSGQSEGSLREDAVAQLTALLTISRHTSQAAGDDELLRYAAAAARQALRASSVSIERFEREHGWLRTLVNDGDLAPGEVPLPEDEVYPIAEYYGLALLDEGEQEGSYSNLDDPEIDPAEARLLNRLGKQCSLEVPINLDGHIWGIIYATRARGEDAFTDRDLDFARSVAAQVAAGIAQGAHTRRLQELAWLDPLTGLASRRALDERLDTLVDEHVARNRAITVVICDVNGLKRVNDEHGHEAGDHLLRQAAEMISVIAGELPGCLAGRLGGDEFCLLVPDLPAEQVVDAVRRLVELAASLPGAAGLACGVASTHDQVGRVDTTGDLLRLADEAQYRAKRAGVAVPVVAGRPLPPEVAAALTSAPGGSSRSGGRRGHDVAGALVNETVDKLDACPGDQAVDRLVLVAVAVSEVVDAATWWIGVATRTDASLRPVRVAANREPGAVGAHGDCCLGEDQSFALDSYPSLDQAARGGWFATAWSEEEPSDPPARGSLAASGCRQLAAAGARRGDEQWLVAVCADEWTRPLAAVGPALRALVAQALSDAG